MKKNNILISIVFVSMSLIGYSQELEQDKVEKLVATLNANLAPTISLKLKNNKGYLKMGELTKTLDLRNTYAISQDTIPKDTKKKFNIPGRYTGSIYWQYDFKEIESSSVQFKANKYEQFFFKISFNEQDTVSLKSKLNVFTSHHKISDSNIHTVTWTGEKYISFLLKPTWINDTIVVEVRGITISGKFARKDKIVITKDYTKKLRKVLRREFEKLIESEAMTNLLSKE